MLGYEVGCEQYPGGAIAWHDPIVTGIPYVIKNLANASSAQVCNAQVATH
jgi:hypothetical protein